MHYKKMTTLGILCMVLFASCCMQNMIYYPTDQILNTPKDIGLEYDSISITTSDEIEISGWWIPANGNVKTVLYFHGNSGNISNCLDKIRLINSLDLNLLIIDYRGFGNSSGSPTEKGLFLDADAAMDYLVAKKNIDPVSIILWGRSLGGAVAARTAAEHDAGMLILESAFTSLMDVAYDISPMIPPWLVKNHSYQTVSYLEKIDIPSLVIHSVDDEVVLFHHGQRLYELISAPKEFVVIHGSHNHGFKDSIDVYISSIRNFVEEVK